MPNNRNRFLDFTPSQEEAVVSRVLVLVHQAIDENFPGVEKAGRQFTKTIFSNDGESTAVSPLPGQTFSENEATSPIGNPLGDSLTSNPANGHLNPPRFPQRAAGVAAEPRAAQVPSSAPTPQKAASQTSQIRGSNSSAASELADSDFDEENLVVSDWPMRLMLALFIAGTILLTYTIFA